MLTFPTLFADHPENSLYFRIRETKPQNNLQEARDPTSGLPDSASEGLSNNAAGRPGSRSPELEPSALPAPELRSKGWGRDLLETKNLSLITGEGLLLGWVWPCKACACALGGGEVRGEWWESPGGPGFLPRFALRILGKMTWVLSFGLFFTPLCNLGTQVCTKWFVLWPPLGRWGVCYSKTRIREGFHQAFFENKPGAAVDVGLTVCMCRDRCIWKWCPKIYLVTHQETMISVKS